MNINTFSKIKMCEGPDPKSPSRRTLKDEKSGFIGLRKIYLTTQRYGVGMRNARRSF